MQINRKCGLVIISLYTNGFWPNSTRPYFSIIIIIIPVIIIRESVLEPGESTLVGFGP